MQKQSNHIYSFFLFVNGGSGGGIGQQMLQEDIDVISYNLRLNKDQSSIQKTELRIFDMRKNRQQGLSMIKHINQWQKSKKSIAIICGGDGTVMWVVSEFIKFGINPCETSLAIIPLGTGNDFSRSLNWGKSTQSWNLSALKNLMIKCLEAEQVDFDLWDIKAVVHQGGKFEKYSDGSDTLISTQILQKTFCNYFSFGIDAKIGYSFDKYRTTNRFGNYAVYGAVGVFNQATTNHPMDYLIDHLYVTLKPDTKDQSYIEFGQQIFNSKEIVGKWKQPLMNMLALNIDSYTGGTTGIWTKGHQLFKKGEKRTEHSCSDGKIQIVGFDSSASIAIEKSFGGLASRLCQGEGPYRFQFKRNQDPQHETYLQVDGQFIKMVRPHYIILRRSQIVPNGKIKVLRNISKQDNGFTSPFEKFMKF